MLSAQCSVLRTRDQGLCAPTAPVAPPAPPGSLAAALAAVPDPRRPRGWRPDRAPLPLVGILQTAVAALLCGARSLYAVAQWGRERVADDPAVLVPLGLPPGRSPSVATLHRVFKGLDIAAFERALGGWLAASGVAADDALALDGKTLRGIQGDAVPGVHLVAAFAHRAGAVLGQAASPGKGQELAAVDLVLGRVPLAGRLVTRWSAPSALRPPCARRILLGANRTRRRFGNARTDQRGRTVGRRRAGAAASRTGTDDPSARRHPPSRCAESSQPRTR